MNTEKLLFDLLRFTLKGEMLADNVKKCIDEESLLKLYAMSKKHDLAHIIGFALAENGLLLKGETAEKFKNQTMLAVYRHEIKMAELKSISELFENEKIEHLQLKGQTVARFYPEPWMRTSCDIDILVSPNDLSRAKTLLCEKLGYECREEGHYEVSLYSPSGMHLELHFKMRESSAQLNKSLDELSNFVVKSGEGEYSLAFKDEFLFSYVVIHAADHFARSGCGIRQILDLWFLDKKLYVSEEALTSLLDERGATLFFERTRQLNAVWMENAEHTQITKKMEEFILGSGVYGTHENYLVLTQEKLGGRRGFFLKRLFLKREHLQFYYPILKKHPYLMPFVQVWRWIQSVFNKKAQNAIREFGNLKKMSEEKTSEITDIVKELGL